MNTNLAYGTTSSTSPVEQLTIKRRELLSDDIEIAVAYCGICHSDIHTARGDWGPKPYPCVPGHEVVGHVSAVGSQVTRHKIGDRVAIGCMVDSCAQCSACKGGDEHFCEDRTVFTYGSPDDRTGGNAYTFGGYSQRVVVRDRFAAKYPESLPLDAGAPLLCAGITSYSPLKKWNVGPGTQLGVAGFGGIGDVAVRLGVALGAEATVLTRGQSKAIDAKAAGATRVVDMTDANSRNQAKRSLDFILSTIPRTHSVDPYLELLKKDGNYCMLGCLESEDTSFCARNVILNNAALSGSHIGGMRETQEMLDFCAEHQIVPRVEVITPDRINEAWNAMIAGNTSHRFVIDVSQMA